MLCALTLAACLPISVSANSPAPANHLSVMLSNLPEEAVYADLLIQLHQDDPQFVDFQANTFVESAAKAE